MFFSHVLLFIFKQLNGERSYMAPYYMLKGKKSGQTMQDIHYYSLSQFFSISPELSKQMYIEEINRLIDTKLIESLDNPIVSEIGKEDIKDFKPQFKGYEINHALPTIDKSLQLLTQVASNTLHQTKSYMAVIPDEEIQRKCKLWIYQIGGVQLASAEIKVTIERFMESKDVSDRQKTLFIYHLSGYQTAGLTWNQLAAHLNCRSIDVLYEYKEVLSQFILFLQDNQMKLADLIIRPSVLTETALQTEKLYLNGYSLEKIAQYRRLKTSTIEDHFVEMGAHRSSVDFSDILTSEDITKVVSAQQQLKTHKLKLLREAVPEYSYFQIRLALAIGGAKNE